METGFLFENDSDKKKKKKKEEHEYAHTCVYYFQMSIHVDLVHTYHLISGVQQQPACQVILKIFVRSTNGDPYLK